MYIKKISLLISSLALLLGASSLNQLSVKKADAIIPTLWESNSGSSVTLIQDGARIHNLNSWGNRVNTTNKIPLDGFEFDFALTNPGASQTCGFYFSSVSKERYNPQDGIANNLATFTLNTQFSAPYSQERFGVFPNRDILNKSASDSSSRTSPNPNMAYDGFGFNDGTLIMNVSSTIKLHFKFEKHDNTFYKVTISEKVPNLIWNNSYHPNYNNGSVYTYVEISRLELDENGEAYLFVYGFKDSGESPVVELTDSTRIVTFNTHGGSSINPIYVDSGSTIKEPSIPNKADYQFDGWYLDSNYTNQFDFSTPIVDNIELHAKWTNVQYTITFNSNGGSEVSPISAFAGASISEPPTPYKADYQFDGWYLDSTFSGERYVFSTMPKGNIVLFAKWKELDKIPPEIKCDISSIEVYSGTKPDESFVAIDSEDGYVPINYTYPSNALDENGKLKAGNYQVTMKAKDKSNNEAIKSFTYNVVDRINAYLISHSVIIHASGCEINNIKNGYVVGDLVSFDVTNNSSNIIINIKDINNNDIQYTNVGNNYKFYMPDSNVIIEANSPDQYINKNSLSAYEEDYICYQGRHYKKDGGMFMSYSNSGFLLDVYITSNNNSITANISASGYEPYLSASGDQYLEAFIDGERYSRIAVSNGTNNITLLSNIAPGAHIIDFKKCNEAQYSNLILNSISLSGVKIKKHLEDRKLIEIYGDSITCGYGTLSSSNKEPFYLSNEDSTLAYAQLTADKLGYRSSTISFSGIALHHSWTDSPLNILDFYKTIDSTSYLAEMRKDTPDIVVINLGTNDNQYYKGLANADRTTFELSFKANLKKMITTILRNNIKTKIIYCYNMMTQLETNLVLSAQQAIEESKSLFDVKDIYMIDFIENMNIDAADGHPNASAHNLNANKLYNFIKNHNLD